MDYSNVHSLALKFLLADQHNENPEFLGSWGKSTLDYCFLSTELQRWIPSHGSITQTAWALLGLKSALNIPRYSLAINAAAVKAESFISKFTDKILNHNEDESSPNSLYRHAATVLLAELLLDNILDTDKRKPANNKQNFANYGFLLQGLSGHLEGHAAPQAKPPSPELCLIALYPLVVQTLISSASDESVQNRTALLKEKTRHWQKHCNDIIAPAAEIIKKFNPAEGKIISRPHVWAAMLDACRLIEDGGGTLAKSAKSTRFNIQNFAVNSLKRLDMPSLPRWNDGSLWEPWSTLALLMTLDGEWTEWKNILAKDIVEQKSNTLGGCTHIWSILLRRANLKNNSHEAINHNINPISDDQTLSQEQRSAKFNLKLWPRFEKNKSARDTRTLEFLKVLVNGGYEARWRELRHFTEMYRGEPYYECFPTLTKGTRCRNIILAGYTGAGKSAVARFLEKTLRIGKQVKRVTTATWNPGEFWEKHHYEIVPAKNFQKFKKSTFATHTLLGAKFAFSVKDFDLFPQTILRIFPVGWSLDAIHDVTKFCEEKGETTRVIALKPSAKILEERIFKKELPLQGLKDILSEAEKFYNSLSSINDVFEVNTSGSEEVAFCSILDILDDVLSTGDGWDVAVSYAGTKARQAKKLRKELEEHGIKCFTADRDRTEPIESDAQQAIDRIFDLADLIIVLYDKEYPTRQFTCHEWVKHIEKRGKLNPKSLYFVLFNGVRLPPNFHKARNLKYKNSSSFQAVAKEIHIILQSIHNP